MIQLKSVVYVGLLQSKPYIVSKRPPAGEVRKFGEGCKLQCSAKSESKPSTRVASKGQPLVMDDLSLNFFNTHSMKIAQRIQANAIWRLLKGYETNANWRLLKGYETIANWRLLKGYETTANWRLLKGYKTNCNPLANF
ncbi:hypothetical protein AVEN_122047-1 [Araneus ventricosus]|uniref:Uncharacterized protein n=1 Tax=Araneus ventricosus TaxID=182803 RepID=A0A4Y2EZF9_ARAVE|nr:hypothetical protein AVEN_122047-1 [Araneus ventricosus]